MSDMCFEDFDYDREDDLHSQAAKLEEEKLTSDNSTAICPKCHGDGGMSIDGGCSNCHGTGEVKQQ